MVTSSEELRRALDTVAAIEPGVAAALHRAGYPEPRLSERGAATLLRTIVGQQVSVASATAVWRKLEAELGAGVPIEAVARATPETLRACGLSRQKIGYAESLAGLVCDGTLDLAALPAEDEAAIAALTAIKGIGRWSAEIYLLFAEGRPDIWPAGDLAVQIETGRLLGLPERPSEKRTRELAEAWRPHRGAMAVFTWHHYNTKMPI